EIRVEFLAFGIEFLHAMPLQRRKHGALGDLDAFDKRLETSIVRSLGLGRDGIERTAQVIRDQKHVARKIGYAVGAGILNVARGATAQVFHVRGRAQRLVLQFLVFLEKPDQRLVVAFNSPFGALAFGFLRLVLVGRVFVLYIIAHRVFPSPRLILS